MVAIPNLIGTSLGVYEVQALLGRGGMASVYQGFDRNLQRLVAIKVLSDAAAAQPGLADRFRQEALLIASLRHMNVVQIYDLGEQDGYTYMVQELLPGPTLEQQLEELHGRGEQLERQDILTIVTQLARALDAAHAAGIIHRDVKPSNAMWRDANTLVLTDFGIAKNTLDEAHQTQAGMVFGTPSYIAPEQAQGLPLTPASDIYALGTVLYQMITGQPPFTGNTPMGILFDHIQTPPPPLRPLRPGLPAAVEDVVLRALAKEPAARFSSAGELARALERAWMPPQAVVAPVAPIHEQATKVWVPPAPVMARPAASPPDVVSAPPVGPATPVASSGSRSTVLILGLLLGLLLLGGVALARRGPAETSASTPLIGPATTVVQATAPAPGPTGVVAAVPTAAPPAPATAQPAVPAAPSPIPATPAPQPSPVPPTPVPPTPTPADLFDQLHLLLAKGNEQGLLDKSGGEMIATLEKARQAVVDGNKQRAATYLRELQQSLRDRKRIDANFAKQALAGIDAIAKNYNLQLASNNNDNSNKDDKKRKD